MLDLPAALAREAPPRDFGEPNDDVRLVKPGGLFPAGSPALTSPAKTKASVRATLEVTEDPADVYRFWVPRHGSATIAAHGTQALVVDVWRSGTRSITERASAAKRDLAATGTGRTRIVNSLGRGGYFYAEVHLAPKVAQAAYTLNVKTSASASR
jgi:hypothetical protein